MSTLALDKDNDLSFTNNRLVLIPGNSTDNEILQRVVMKLKFVKDEWYLNSDHGIPYFQDILGEKNIDLNIFDSILKEEILLVNGVKEITESSISFNKLSRDLEYSFSAITDNSTIITTGLITI